MKKDSAEILRANELLSDPKATAADLKDARQAINEAGQQYQTRINADAAKSFAERESLENAERERSAAAQIHNSLYGELSRAIESAEAREAFANNDAVVASLKTATDKLEKAQRVVDEARDAVQEQTALLKTMKQAVGRARRTKIGAPAELIDRVAQFGVHDVRLDRQTAINALRSQAQIGCE